MRFPEDFRCAARRAAPLARPSTLLQAALPMPLSPNVEGARTVEPGTVATAALRRTDHFSGRIPSARQALLTVRRRSGAVAGAANPVGRSALREVL